MSALLMSREHAKWRQIEGIGGESYGKEHNPLPPFSLPFLSRFPSPLERPDAGGKTALLPEAIAVDSQRWCLRKQEDDVIFFFLPFPSLFFVVSYSCVGLWRRHPSLRVERGLGEKAVCHRRSGKVKGEVSDLAGHAFFPLPSFSSFFRMCFTSHPFDLPHLVRAQSSREK